MSATMATRMKFQSTLSVRRATYLSPFFRDGNFVFQSTLSVRRATGVASTGVSGFEIFQSTLSVRRATPAGLEPTGEKLQNFNPRSP